MLELWGMRSTPSLPSLPGPLWPGVIASDRVLSMGQIELNCELMLNRIVWNKTAFHIKTAYLCLSELLEIELFWHLTECKQKTILKLSWIIWNKTLYKYKNGFGINNLQWMMDDKTKQNQTKLNLMYF